MFVDTGQAAFDHTTDAYFWRITPADDVKGYALALWAHKAGYTRGGRGVRQTTRGAQSDVADAGPRLHPARRDHRLQQALRARPEFVSHRDREHARGAIRRSSSPRSIRRQEPRSCSELQQLHGLIPVIGTEVTLQAPWLKAVTGAIGASAMAKVLRGYAAVRAAERARLGRPTNRSLLASGSQVPKPQPVEQRPVLDDLLRRGQRDGAGDDRGQEHQPGGFSTAMP